MRHFTFTRRSNERPYNVIKIRSAFREVEVTFSPTGRVAHVWLDGEKLEPTNG